MINKWLNIQTKLYQKNATDTAEIHILQKKTKNFNKNQIKLILKIVFLKKNELLLQRVTNNHKVKLQ